MVGPPAAWQRLREEVPSRRRARARAGAGGAQEYEQDPCTAFDEPGGNGRDPRVFRHTLRHGFAEQRADGNIGFRVEGPPKVGPGSGTDVVESLSANDWARLAGGDTRNKAQMAIRTRFRLFKAKYGRWETAKEIKAFAIYQHLNMVFPENWEEGWLPSWFSEREGETPEGELNTALAIGEVDPPSSNCATPSSTAAAGPRKSPSPTLEEPSVMAMGGGLPPPYALTKSRSSPNGHP